MNINIFIDYDNVYLKIDRIGLTNYISHLISKIQSRDFENVNRVQVRLYGGWIDEMGNMTINAIRLSNECFSEYPRVETIVFDQKEFKFIINSELANSLLEVPGVIFNSTYRTKQLNNSVRTVSKDKIGCVNLNCPASIIHKVVSKKKCHILECEKKLNELMYRNEQKMVDTLIVCDMLYTSSFTDVTILASEDEDFVPLLKTLSSKGNNIYIVQDFENRSTINAKHGLQLNTINI